ncbi:MAG: FKBP-type peptidyl-prolyl cis-trans isomerase SlyD [Bacteriovoracaceae bacterium]|jgi:FKBP-type peptidyl-prolyl cis-trans isomerase SlyD
MKIAKDCVVSIQYTLKGDDGAVMDSSEGQDPLTFLQGHGNLIPGLEKALEGKSKGEELKVSIAPEDGYGPYRDELVQDIPKSNFDPGQPLAVGDQFQVETEVGPLVVQVTKIEGENVSIDGNHPMAGKTLNFEVKVEEVREATEEELSHGHAHGPGGHNH